MQVQFADRLTIDRSHRTGDGYMRVVAKGARAGIQQYLGREVDPEGKHFAADRIVNVYRPPEEVFAAKAVASFIGKPITDNHPAEAVTAKNWRDHTRGVIGGAVRDGEWLRFDVALMDADLIGKVEAGKRELSGGYACDLAIESGTTADGQKYDAIQRGIVGNHLAVVDRARAGSEARISDGGNALFQLCDAAAVILNVTDDGEPRMSKKIMLDGLQVDLADAAAVEVAFGKLQAQLADAVKAKADLETQVATLTTDKATLDAKVTTLEKQLADSKLTPAQLRDAAKAYQQTVDKAKELGVTVADSMDETAIQKAAVTAKIGDASKDWNDAQIAASFATLTAGVKPADPVRQAFGDGLTNVNDAEADYARAREERRRKLGDAWKTPANAA